MTQPFIPYDYALAGGQDMGRSYWERKVRHDRFLKILQTYPEHSDGYEVWSPPTLKEEEDTTPNSLVMRFRTLKDLQIAAYVILEHEQHFGFSLLRRIIRDGRYFLMVDGDELDAMLQRPRLAPKPDEIEWHRP